MQLWVRATRARVCVCACVCLRACLSLWVSDCVCVRVCARRCVLLSLWKGIATGGMRAHGADRTRLDDGAAAFATAASACKASICITKI